MSLRFAVFQQSRSQMSACFCSHRDHRFCSALRCLSNPGRRFHFVSRCFSNLDGFWPPWKLSSAFNLLLKKTPEWVYEPSRDWGLRLLAPSKLSSAFNLLWKELQKDYPSIQSLRFMASGTLKTQLCLESAVKKTPEWVSETSGDLDLRLLAPLKTQLCL